MGCHHELGALPRQQAHLPQQGELPRGGQGGLRLIQQVEPLPAEAVLHQGQEALPVGLGVEGNPAVAVQQAGAGLLVQPVDIAGRVVEALRPEKEAVPGVGAAGDGEILPQGRVGVPGGEGEVPGAPLRVEAAGDGDALQQGGLPRPVLPHQEGDRAVEGQPLPRPQLGQGGQPVQPGVLRQRAAQEDLPDIAGAAHRDSWSRPKPPPGGVRPRCS